MHGGDPDHPEGLRAVPVYHLGAWGALGGAGTPAVSESLSTQENLKSQFPNPNELKHKLEIPMEHGCNSADVLRSGHLSWGWSSLKVGVWRLGFVRTLLRLFLEGEAPAEPNSRS